MKRLIILLALASLTGCASTSAPIKQTPTAPAPSPTYPTVVGQNGQPVNTSLPLPPPPPPPGN